MRRTSDERAELVSVPVIWAVFIGGALAAGATYLLNQNFASGAEPAVGFPVLFAVGGVFSILLAWLTVGANAYRAANTNPAHILSYE